MVRRCPNAARREGRKIKLRPIKASDAALEGEREDAAKREIMSEMQELPALASDSEELASPGSFPCAAGAAAGSASGNIAAKASFPESHSSAEHLACCAHQLKLIAGSALVRENANSAAASAKLIAIFFSKHSKRKAQLQRRMIAANGKAIELGKQGGARWLSHFGLLVSLFEARKALELRRLQMISECNQILSKEAGMKSPTAIGDAQLWRKLELLASLIRPIAIEIKLMERGELA